MRLKNYGGKFGAKLLADGAAVPPHPPLSFAPDRYKLE